MKYFYSIEYNRTIERRSIDRFATMIAAISPVLGIYNIGFPGITLLDIFVIPIVLLYLLYGYLLHRVIRFIIVLFITLSLLSLLLTPMSVEDLHLSAMASRSGKFILYILFIGFLAKRLDSTIFLQTLNAIGFIAYCGVFLQYSLLISTGSFFGIWIPGLEFAGDRTQAEVISSLIFYKRPSSLFIEPAHLSYFFTIHFISLLYEGRMRIWIWFVFVTIVYVTQSSYGLFLLITISFFYFFQLLRKNFSRISAAIIIAIFVSTFILISIDFILEIYMVQRLFDPASVALTGRTEAGKILVDQLSGLQAIFGVGFGNIESPIYMSFMYTTVYSFGWLGFFIIIFVWIWSLIILKDYRFVSVVILLPLSIASPVLYSFYVIPFALLVLSGPTKRSAFVFERFRLNPVNTIRP